MVENGAGELRRRDRAERGAGAARGARRAGLRPRPSGWAGRRPPPAAGDRRRRAAAARLGQRLRPLPLRAAVLPARPLSAGDPRPDGGARGRLRRARRHRARPVRVLGARSLAAAGRAAAAAALADGPRRPVRLEVGAPGRRRAAAAAGGGAGDGSRARPDPRRRPRHRAAAAPRRGDVELERGQDRARVPLLRRPALGLPPGQLRTPLRPARADPAGRRARGADAARGGGAAAAAG